MQTEQVKNRARRAIALGLGIFVVVGGLVAAAAPAGAASCGANVPGKVQMFAEGDTCYCRATVNPESIECGASDYP